MPQNATLLHDLTHSASIYSKACQSSPLTTSFYINPAWVSLLFSVYLTKSTCPVLPELFDSHITINSLQRAQLKSLNIIFFGGLTLWAQTVIRSLRSAFRHERISSVVLNHFSASHQGASAVFIVLVSTHTRGFRKSLGGLLNDRVGLFWAMLLDVFGYTTWAMWLGLMLSKKTENRLLPWKRWQIVEMYPQKY